ncbi:MAG: prolipoprotein diacylglyceryl transferase [Epsilonproteobacteria bacterium]|nr:prolipoprotein diacylglyceryl transferase [Campylobacterota bacterium]
MNYWQHIYEHFNVVAFQVWIFKIHWYAIMYILALLVALYVAKYLINKDNIGIDNKTLDEYFVWVEIGVILGARIGYFVFYVPENSYYLLHPWQMFNPFIDGHFVGIRGMSYHGAVIGFGIATLLFVKFKKVNLWKLLDVVAVAIPAGYVFGRIGNFLNQELIGRVTDVPWGIYVHGILRHPSQLYEAFFEGIVIFIILFLRRKHKKFDGELISLYMILYGIFRSFCELFRMPDVQLGFVIGHFTMGELLSFVMILGGVIIYMVRSNEA